MLNFTAQQLIDFFSATKKIYQNPLADYFKQYPLIPDYQAAAILILIVNYQDELRVLLTQRTQHLTTHAGQISFPGGGVESTDHSLQATALRETYEEIGIKPETITILGELTAINTLTSKYIVHPLIGLIQAPYQLNLDPFEVERIIEVPLTWLLNPNNQQMMQINYQNKILTVPAISYQEDIIWGVTKRIITNLCELLDRKKA